MADSESFVLNINKLAQNLDLIKEVKELFDIETVDRLETLSNIDISLIMEDLQKGNYLGNRKIDIDLSLNNLSELELPTYQKADVTLVDGTLLEIEFDNGSGGVLELSSHADIKSYIDTHELWLNNVINTEIVVNEAFGEEPAMIRIRDADGQSSNVERIELYVYAGNVSDTKPAYFWANTTSALETLANRAGDIIQLGNDIGSIVTLSQRIDELISLQEEISKLISIYDYLTQVISTGDNISSVKINAENITNININAENISTINEINSNMTKLIAIHQNITNILAAEGYATVASEKAQEATDKVALIQAISVQGQTLAAGQSVTVSYNSVTNKFTFAIPQGVKGDRGEAFKVNAIGTLAQRDLYDDEQTNFSYLASDVDVDGSEIPHIYFKKSDTNSDWTSGIPFGRGEKGDSGDPGIGVVSVARTSGDGTPGSTDIYTITLSDGNTHEFSVYNGTDSDINSSDLNALSTALTNTVNAHKNDKENPHNVTKVQLGLGNVDNTSDTDKPISAAVAEALASKANSNEVITKDNTTVAEDINFAGNITFSGSIADKTDAYLLGQPGEVGFGVATAQASWISSIGATALEGHDVKTSPNYGNYLHIASGAVLVCIPKHYYKISGNTISFSDTVKAGYVIDRSFLNGDGVGGTVEADCIFVAKYGLTLNGTIASAQKGMDPLSTNSAHNPISQLTGTPSNTYGGLYAAVKTMDSNAFLTPIFVYSMLARMAKAHSSASAGTNVCAFVDVNPKMPKGNLNSALCDVNDTSVTFTSSGYSDCALTGSGVPFAKTTHNGQNCGVADLNGNMWEVASGFIRTSANGFMILKEAVDIRTISSDNTTQSAGGAYDIDLYDMMDISDLVSSNAGWTYLGNETNQVFGFSTDINNAVYKRTSIGVPLATGVSAAGTTEFGNDGFYRYLRDEMAPLVGGRWNNTSNAGAFCVNLYNTRTTSSNTVGGRASFLVQ